MDPFEACVRNGRLRLFKATEETLVKEIQGAKEELALACSSFRDGRFERTVVQSYFAMYRSCKSLVFAAGYQSTNLYSLVTGIWKLYVSPGAIDPDLIELMKIARDQKDLVLEEARCTERDSQLLLNAANRLVVRACEILAIPDIPPPESAFPV